MTSFLARFEGGGGVGTVLGRVSSLGQGVSSSLSKLLPRPPPSRRLQPAAAAAGPAHAQPTAAMQVSSFQSLIDLMAMLVLEILYDLKRLQA